jgi:hypothetical protein
MLLSRSSARKRRLRSSSDRTRSRFSAVAVHDAGRRRRVALEQVQVERGERDRRRLFLILQRRIESVALAIVTAEVSAANLSGINETDAVEFPATRSPSV